MKTRLTLAILGMILLAFFAGADLVAPAPMQSPLEPDIWATERSAAELVEVACDCSLQVGFAYWLGFGSCLVLIGCGVYIWYSIAKRRASLDK